MRVYEYRRRKRQERCWYAFPMKGGAQNSNHVDQILPFPFWRVSVGRRRSPPSGEPQVSRGDPWVILGCAYIAEVMLLPGPVIFRPNRAARRKPGMQQDQDR